MGLGPIFMFNKSVNLVPEGNDKMKYFSNKRFKFGG